MSSKCAVERKSLQKALTVLGHVTSKRCSLPVLSCIKVKSNGVLELTATDLDYTVKARLPLCESGDIFTVLIPTDRLAGTVKSGKTPKVILEPEGQDLKLDVAKITGMDLSTYPCCDHAKKESLVARVPAREFSSGVIQTMFCKSSEIVRYALTGFLVEANKTQHRLNLVASDGKRLAWQKVPAKVAKPMKRLLVPEGILLRVLELAKLEPDADIEIFSTPDGEYVRFQVGDRFEVFGRTIEGCFPTYEAVIPHDHETVVSVGRACLVSALEQIGPALNESHHAVQFDLKNGGLELYTKDPEKGEARINIPVEGPGTAKVVLNQRFVLEYLNALPKECAKVKVWIEDEKSGTKWVAEGIEGHVYVLMPLSVVL